MPVADYSTEVNPNWVPPNEVEPVEYSTFVYGLLSFVIFTLIGYLGMRWYNEYAAKHNIRKEINKRFKFKDEDRIDD